MTKGKSWTLLASYLDQSFVRDKVGLDLGRRMNNIAWTPDSRYVELFVNDQYRGAYLMTESVKIDGDRVNIRRDQRHDHGDRRNVGRPTRAWASLSTQQDRLRVQGSRTSATLRTTPTRRASTSAKLTADQEPGSTRSSRSCTARPPRRATSTRTILDVRPRRSTTTSSRSSQRTTTRTSTAVTTSRGNMGGTQTEDHVPTVLRRRKVPLRSRVGLRPERRRCHRHRVPVYQYFASPTGWYLRGTGTGGARPNYKTHWFVQLFKDPGVREPRSRRAGPWSEQMRSSQDDAGQTSRVGRGRQGRDRCRRGQRPEALGGRGQAVQCRTRSAASPATTERSPS